jgi:hypothetical protein
MAVSGAAATPVLFLQCYSNEPRLIPGYHCKIALEFRTTVSGKSGACKFLPHCFETSGKADIISLLLREVFMKSLTAIAVTVLALSTGGAMAQTAAEREACQGDYEKFCSGVQQGGGRIIECLSKHLDQLTPQCKSIVEANMPK